MIGHFLCVERIMKMCSLGNCIIHFLKLVFLKLGRNHQYLYTFVSINQSQNILNQTFYLFYFVVLIYSDRRARWYQFSI